uniref:Uncharacterized protein n=1 Tax=Bracon brevicornis TaxID=1563983 RepID=A0A6V7IUL7_9HYME
MSLKSLILFMAIIGVIYAQAVPPPASDSNESGPDGPAPGPSSSSSESGSGEGGLFAAGGRGAEGGVIVL